MRVSLSCFDAIFYSSNYHKKKKVQFMKTAEGNIDLPRIYYIAHLNKSANDELRAE